MKRGFRSVLKWTLTVVVSGGIAYGIAAFWNKRSEANFLDRLPKMSTAELETLAKKNEMDPAVHYWLGAKYLQENKDPQALKALAHSLGLDPNVAQARAALGLALARTGDPISGEVQLKEAIRLAPKQAYSYVVLSSLYMQYKRWQQGRETLEQLTQMEPNNDEAWQMLARCYGETFQEDKKLEILERLAKKLPNDVPLLKSLGYVYLFYGKFSEAEQVYRKILALAPEDLETHYLLGRALAELANSPEQFAASEQELRGVVAKAPTNPGVHLALGILHFRRNEFPKSVASLEKAVSLGITENKTWMYLGQAYARVGQKAKAKETLEQFQKWAGINRMESQLENRLQNTPDDDPVRLRLAKVYMEASDYQRAANHLDQFLRRQPNSAEAKQLYATCSKNLQNPSQKPMKSYR